MNILNSIKTCVAKSFRFSGRATRSEYWWYLFSYIAVYTISFFLLFGVRPDEEMEVSVMGDYAFLFGMLVLAFPLLAAGIRRLHDIGRSAWWLFMPPIVGLLTIIGFYTLASKLSGTAYSLGVLITLFVPAISFFLVLFWLAKPGRPDSNKFGERSQ